MSQGLTAVAENLLRNIQTNFPRTVDVVEVDEADFRHLRLSDYHAFRKWIEGRGFRYLNDIAIPAFTASPTSVLQPTMIRQYLSSDGATLGGFYQTRPRMARIVRNLMLGLIVGRFIAAPAAFANQNRTSNYVEFETEFDDGTFLITSNAAAAGVFELPPGLDAEYLDARTKAGPVLKRHKERLVEKRRKSRTNHPRVLFTADDVGASQARLQLMKHEHRKSLGWYTLKELTALSGNASLAAAIYAEIRNCLGLDREADGRPQTDSASEMSEPTEPAIERDHGFKTVTLHSNRGESSGDEAKPLSVEELARYALGQGIAQVKAVGSPLNSFLIDENKRICFMLDESGGADLMSLVLETIRKEMPDIRRAAFVMDSRLGFEDGKTWDAISVMVCERGNADAGQVWAQRYVPKGLLRKFRTEGEPEVVAKSKDFISAALEHTFEAEA